MSNDCYFEAKNMLLFYNKKDGNILYKCLNSGNVNVSSAKGCESADLPVRHCGQLVVDDAHCTG